MKLKILLVDDNAIQAATRCAILTGAGENVTSASSAEEALRQLARPEISQVLGLVITDHLMPGMNGPQLVSKLRETMPDVPVLVLSGLPDAELEYEGMDITFRLKPFPPDDLIRIVALLLSNNVRRTA